MNIKDNILIADTGKTLYFTPENRIWGRTARLGVNYKEWTLSKYFSKLEEHALQVIPAIFNIIFFISSPQLIN